VQKWSILDMLSKEEKKAYHKQYYHDHEEKIKSYAKESIEILSRMIDYIQEYKK
jgi:hypothetical protein